MAHWIRWKCYIPCRNAWCQLAMTWRIKHRHVLMSVCGGGGGSWADLPQNVDVIVCRYSRCSYIFRYNISIQPGHPFRINRLRNACNGITLLGMRGFVGLWSGGGRVSMRMCATVDSGFRWTTQILSWMAEWYKNQPHSSFGGGAPGSNQWALSVIV